MVFNMRTLTAGKIKSRALSTSEIRCKMMNLQSKLVKSNIGMMGDSKDYAEKCPLKHTYGEGCYIRELLMPKGMLFITRIHRFKHPYFILKGDVSILTEKGVKRLTAPYSGITEAGTKRIIYTHTETIWCTVHVTNETDPKKAVKELTVENFEELDNVKEVVCTKS